MEVGRSSYAPRLPYPLRLVTFSGGEAFTLARIEGVPTGRGCVEHDVSCLAYSLSASRSPASIHRGLGPGPAGRERRAGSRRGQSAEFGGRIIVPEEVLGPPAGV